MNDALTDGIRHGDINRKNWGLVGSDLKTWETSVLGEEGRE